MESNALQYCVTPKKSNWLHYLATFLWKVMRYNIALLPKKVTNYVT